jgi:hypothetical protein
MMFLGMTHPKHISRRVAMPKRMRSMEHEQRYNRVEFPELVIIIYAVD